MFLDPRPTRPLDPLLYPTKSKDKLPYIRKGHRYTRRIQDFPGGAPTYYLAKFCKELHETKEIRSTGKVRFPSSPGSATEFTKKRWLLKLYTRNITEWQNVKNVYKWKFICISKVRIQIRRRTYPFERFQSTFSESKEQLLKEMSKIWSLLFRKKVIVVCRKFLLFCYNKFKSLKFKNRSERWIWPQLLEKLFPM